MSQNPMRSLKRYSFTYLKELHCTVTIVEIYRSSVATIRATALCNKGYCIEINVFFHSCFYEQFCVLTTQWMHGHCKKKNNALAHPQLIYHDHLIKTVEKKKMVLEHSEWFMVLIYKVLDLTLITGALLLLRLKHKQPLHKTTCITPSAP